MTVPNGFTPIEIEPFDHENPKGSLGLRRRRLKLHQEMLDALRRLLARSLVHEYDKGLFRALIYRLECEVKNDKRDLELDELDELDRLNRIAGLAPPATPPAEDNFHYGGDDGDGWPDGEGARR